MLPRICRRRILLINCALPARERARRRRDPRGGVRGGTSRLRAKRAGERVLKLSRQPYYRWLAAPIPEAVVVEAYRANALFDAHRDDPEFGYRYLADEAEASGQPMAARTAWRLCSSNAWFSAFGKGRAKNGKKPGPPVHDDLCAVVDADGKTRHEFRADGPNQLWLTDVSEHHTNEGVALAP